MITVAISMLFGFTAFAAIATIAMAITRGIARGQAILGELAELDAYAGEARSRSHINRSGRGRPEVLVTQLQRPFSAV